jgi:hypothetical protein
MMRLGFRAVRRLYLEKDVWDIQEQLYTDRRPVAQFRFVPKLTLFRTMKSSLEQAAESRGYEHAFSGDFGTCASDSCANRQGESSSPGGMIYS